MFSLFVCIFLGLLMGRINIKGISLGSSGVFIIALLYGALFSSHIKSTISQKTKEGQSIDISSNGLKIIENIGLILFIGSVGFISGPTFFKNLKKNFKSYIFVGLFVIGISTISCVIIFYIAKKNIKNINEFTPIMVGIFAGALTSTPAFSAAKASVNSEFESVVTVGYGIAYIFGVLGVVLFVQIIPKILGVDLDLERELIIDKGYKINKRIGTERTEKTDITRISKAKYLDKTINDSKNKKINLEKSDLKSDIRSEEERGIESDKRIVRVVKKEKKINKAEKEKDKIKEINDEKEFEIINNNKKNYDTILSIEKGIESNKEIEKLENEKGIVKSNKEDNKEIKNESIENGENDEKEKEINIIIIDEKENNEEEKENEIKNKNQNDFDENSQKENISYFVKENNNNKDLDINSNKEENKLFTIDKNGFSIFAFGAIVGIFIGAIRIPLSKKGFSGSAFSLTTTGGVLLTCLILGHFGKICKLSLKVEKKLLEDFREIGLILFLLGSGISGGTKFVEYFKIIYFLYGIIITILPLILGFLFNKYILKLYLFNNLGSLTGAMTSTPALGTLINVAKTDQVGNSYAATYPISLISVVLSAQFMALLMK